MSDTPPRRPRFQQDMPADLKARVEDYAAGFGISRNSAINILCTHALDMLDAAQARAGQGRNERDY